MTTSAYAKYQTETVNDLGIRSALRDYFITKIELIIKDFFVTYNDKFHGIFDKEIYNESLKVRKNALDLIETECKTIVKGFNEDRKTFEYNYGWYENLSAEIRHKITIDELYHELCELIREIYYVDLESRFPEKYKVTVAEEFLLRGEIESKFS
jgi:hypothetical protein